MITISHSLSDVIVKKKVFQAMFFLVEIVLSNRCLLA